MVELVFILIFILIIMGVIYLMNLYFSVIKNFDKEKKSAYECGFNPVTKAFIPFSIPFYLMGLMFLIFDVEIVMIVPMIYFIKYLEFKLSMIIFLIFLGFMILSLLFEWYKKYLNWLY